MLMVRTVSRIEYRFNIAIEVMKIIKNIIFYEQNNTRNSNPAVFFIQFLKELNIIVIILICFFFHKIVETLILILNCLSN